MKFVILFLLVGTSAVAKVSVALNWKPEPQFGGFYTAVVEGLDKKIGIELEILQGGSGTPTVQMVASGKVPFGIASADEIVMARDRGMKIVALLAVYQTNPQGIMTHAELNYQTIADVFKGGGTLAMQKGLGYSLFLEKKFGFQNVNIVPYAGGIANFLHDPKFSQQCFVTSEPLIAKKQGKNPKTFLVAEAGYNPYTTVLVTTVDYLKLNPETVSKVVKLFKSSWERYLSEPTATNQHMHKLNATMDLATFSESAEAQKPLIMVGDAVTSGVGAMVESRWKELSVQLQALGLVKKILPPKDYFKAF